MSVPSIFSQLYEQASAFSNIVYNYPYGNPVRDSEEVKRTSLCLDLFELILMRGAEVFVAHIDLGDIQQLSQSPDPNHQLLASIVTEDLQHPNFRNIADGYLFGWRNFLLGGTSPMTIVYTSPNIIRDFQQENIRGFGGNVLFRDVAPLHQRGNQFREFMYEYRHSFPLPIPLREYIDRSMQIDHVVLVHGPIDMTSKYAILTDSNGNPIYVNDVPILHLPPRVEESDYMIIPHKTVKGKLPLVLSEPGLPGARYILGMQWDPYAFHIPHDIWGIPLEERILPGTNIRHPFVTIDDLLELRIIQVPKGIDSKRFITCCIGDSDYLLPIRRMYFEYFTPEDLKNSLSVEIIDSDSVRVKLVIPVRGGIIEFQRVYHDEDIVSLNINIAVTPIYQLEGEKYHLLCSNEKNTELHIGNSNSTYIDTGVTHTTRYQDEKREVGCYTINDSWDYLTICSHLSDSDAVVGIIVPIFRRDFLAREECVFCVDMGDSYTTIMHKRRDEHMPQPLYMDEPILGVLCPVDEMFKYQIKKYFLEALDINRPYSPLKNLLTVTHDVIVMKGLRNFKFLENYTIPLNYNEFTGRGEECFLRPSLHNLNFPTDVDSLRAYFEGLLFIMKQEAILRYNSPTFDLRVAVPSYFNATERERFEQVLIEAHHASGTNYCNDTMFVSSPAAMALFSNSILAPIGDKVTIHIDSMYTHISHCDYDGKIRTVNVGMGIGDLFQNTVRLYGNDEYFVSRVTHQYLFPNGVYSPDEIQKIDSHIQYDQWSLFDVFENEWDCNKNGNIIHCGQLGACAMEIVTVYLIGLFYYLGRYLGEMNIRQPHAVVFSGLGAKYLSQYFRNDRSVERLFDSIMRLVQGDDYEPKNTRMLFYDNPTQAISKGLMIDGMVADETIDCFYGLDDNVNNPVHLREVMDKNVGDDIHSAFRHFIAILNSNELRDVLSQELNISLGTVMNNIGALVNMAMDSVNRCINEKLEFNKLEDRCNDALFFWSLKHSLYEWLKNNC